MDRIQSVIAQIRAWLEQTVGLSPETQGRLLASLITILVLWALRRIVLWLVWRRVTDVRSRYRWQKTSMYFVVPIGILLVGRIWFEGFQSLATFLGLVSAGIAIALKDLLVNLAGWAFILWRRPFEVGDRVQIGEHAGDVIDIRTFQFSLLEIGNWVDADQSTGRVLHVPNGAVMTQTLANYSRGMDYIWNELPILITFESNWRKAKNILTDVVRTHAEPLSAEAERQLRLESRRFLIFYTNLTPIVYTSVADSGVMLTLRYLVEPRKRRGTAQAIWEAVLDQFGREADIDFAYPTRRFYQNQLEGKAGAGGPPTS